VPLSEHEQRLLEQIERALLAEDPKFASTVRATDPRHYALRRVVLATVLVLAGVGLMVFGVVTDFAPAGIPIFGILGFVVMFGAAVLGVQSYRRAGRAEPLRVVGSERRSRGGRSPSSRSSLLDRLEDRWRRRADGDR
jgi:hypothetical protein